ncbi:hypothetical protein MCOR07_002588 [Pyricularia oryzae]|uniref:Uncharacterized protein n=1 Tax=Pyricularia oryzae TaxID=318829 RepID=A0A4P7NK72_PYROR|nr:hypothetical protein MCOR32_008049 [Pyricularia oryzae]KAI6467255.1 hypothetical protein MCOR18_009735 [Pyricularia oryzae]KAI6626111.1 hypothetical protein MCOR07_002588 [Pyricularia oryzae]QBZ62473.1 hypothetical protein PoMZ_11354 [Pyricularia oryzae]
MLFRNGAKSQITSALSSTGFRSKSSPREKSPTRKEACVTLNGEMSFSPDVQHTDLEVLSNSKGKRFKKVQLRDGNDTLGRLASVCALSQRKESSRVRTTSTSHTQFLGWRPCTVVKASQGLTLGTTKYRVDAIKKDLGNDQAWSVIDGLVPHRFDRKGLIS